MKSLVFSLLFIAPVVFGPTALAATNPAVAANNSAEPWQTPIQDAQKSIVAKNRKAAADRLLHAIREEKFPARGKAKLMESLQALSEVFFTDQGQRLYETGQSLAFENPETATARFHDALQIEDNNVMILLAMARLQLARKDCTAADQSLTSAAAINPFDDTSRFLRAKVLLCSHKPMEALVLLKQDLGDDPVKNVTMASALIENGAAKDANSLLQKAAGKDALYPEVHYWIWKTTIDEDVAEEQGQKYVALCKNLNLRTRRKYMNEPRLCAQTQEVEDALKAAQKNTDS
jgi:hypothetical protein